MHILMAMYIFVRRPFGVKFRNFTRVAASLSLKAVADEFNSKQMKNLLNSDKQSDETKKDNILRFFGQSDDDRKKFEIQ